MLPNFTVLTFVEISEQSLQYGELRVESLRFAFDREKVLDVNLQNDDRVMGREEEEGSGGEKATRP